MTDQPVIDLEQVRDGDILLFSGPSLFSLAIRAFTDSPWSHCGMVIYPEPFENNAQNSSAQIWDVSKKTYGGTVETYDLSKRLSAYDGMIAYRPLYHKSGMRGFLPPEKEAFRSIYDSLIGRPYEANKLELFKAAFDPKILSYEMALNEPDLSSIFCGELLAETYQRLGLFPKEKPSNEFVPADFSSDRLTILQKDYYFGDEVIIKQADTSSL